MRSRPMLVRSILISAHLLLTVSAGGIAVATTLWSGHSEAGMVRGSLVVRGLRSRADRDDGLLNLLLVQLAGPDQFHALAAVV